MQLLQNFKTPIVYRASKITKTAVLSISTAFLLCGLTACQTSKNLFSKVEDGSLKYQQTSKTAPLKLPAEQETAPFIPLYQTPKVGVNTLELENDSGKRYELPPPYRQVSVE